MTGQDESLWELVLGGREAVVATIRRNGYPQLSNVLYVVDRETSTVRISTTAARAKARNLARDPRAVLHVAGDNFWAYAVAEGQATLSTVAETPGDDACQELLAVHSSFYGELKADEFYEEMVANQRLVIRIELQRVYGIVATGGRRPQSRHSEAEADT